MSPSSATLPVLDGVVRPSLRARWAALALFTVLTAALLVIRPASPRAMMWLDGVACVLAHFATAAIAALAPARRDPSVDESKPRLPISCWVPLSAGVLLMAVGQALYYYNLLVARERPFPSLADVGFALSYPFLIAGILCLPGRRMHRTRAFLDSLIAIAALAAFSWYFLVGPTIALGGPSPLGRILAPAYPLLDLVALFCLLLVGASARSLRSHPGTRAISAGLVLIVAADAVFGYLNLKGTWPEGTLLDLAWPAGYGLIGLGAAHLRARPPVDAAAGDNEPDALPSVWRAALPYLLFPFVGALVVYIEFSGNDHTPAGRGAYAWAVLLIAAVVTRQVFSIRENAHLNRHLRASEARFRAIFERAGVGIVLVDPAGRFVTANPELARMLGYAPDELAGLPFAALTHPDDIAAGTDLYRQLAAGRLDHYQLEKRYVHKDGHVVWGRLTVSLVPHGVPGSQNFAVGMVEDVTARKQAEEQMAFQATHDALTGLPNRPLFLFRVERCLARARADDRFRFAVLFLDLDRFKTINDSLGHAAGDHLLQAVARRLRAVVDRLPGSHTVARLGGDEFTLLLEDLANLGQVQAVARELLASVGLPYDVAGHEVITTPSIGVVSGTPGYASAADLLRDADAAMYAAKSAGKNRYTLFDPAMHDAALRRLRLEADLRRAVERGELLLHYQPILSLESRQTVGFEALVRWNRDGRLVSPADFIPVAEDTGLILPIGTWVLREACRQLASWHATLPDLSMSVNLSRRQLADPGLVSQLLAILRETGIRPSCLKLEITESVVMEDGAAALETLKQLKRTGVQLSLDDFGTGYSSLSLLHEFPIDVLKLDRSFLSQVSDRRDSAAVVGAVIALAHNLNMKVVAEGIETPDHVAFLQALDCDLAQGYLFSKPLPAPAATAFLTPSLRLSA